MAGERRTRRDRLTFEQRVLLLALASGLPAVLVAIALLVGGGHSARVVWTLGILVGGWWLALALALRERVVRPLQTLSNMLAALREGDYSIRARAVARDDSLALAYEEANGLGEYMRAQRFGALEATALLRTVMAEIDVAVFAFDGSGTLRLVNRAGARLLARPVEWLVGHDAWEIGLGEYLEGEAPRSVDATFPGGGGRWEVRRTEFRQGGLPHRLLVLADVSRALREEEIKAWQRLVRVLSHEINNSLAPIKSIAGSLRSMLGRPTRAPDLDEDLTRGLDVIAGRADALGRFMSAYALLARLPQPAKRPVDIGAMVHRVAALEPRLTVAVCDGPPTIIEADGDQLDQLLINLVRNAVDASLETGGGVRIGWQRVNGFVELRVEDEGPGIADASNLFVPFFTTKPNGSGIGLVLSRQIAEAHGGTLTLEPREEGRGVRARVRVPG